MKTPEVRIIASYLPQFHPIPENDEWWGQGFTEWTNVGKAKPLFRGHYQPKVPADLGYYDLRLPESRKAQADLAREYGVEGFCYWHYWFGNGRRLLERPFNEVLASGEPDFPFCLGWANHSWEDKQFSKDGSNKMLIEQIYGGEADYTEHFYAMLPAFKDKRHICVDGKPVFFIYLPLLIPNLTEFLDLWRKLALENGLKGFHFVAHTHNLEDIDLMIQKGFDAVNIVRLFHFFKQEFSVFQRVYIKIMRVWFKRGQIFDYRQISKYFTGVEDTYPNCYPSLIPNWDHSPRSGRKGHIFAHSNPVAFKKHAKAVFANVMNKPKDQRIVFLKSWNEWAEGNYIEPDLKFGRGYLEALKEAISEVE